MTSFLHKLNGSEFKVCRLQDCCDLAGQAVMDKPEAIVNYLRTMLPNSIAYRPDTENLIVVHLSTRKKPIGFEVISNGTLDTLLVHPREVFKSAIIANSDSIVIAHNHPSGNPSPSKADIKLTRDLIRAGQLMKIEVCDHIVLGVQNSECPKGYASLRELGYF